MLSIFHKRFYHEEINFRFLGRAICLDKALFTTLPILQSILLLLFDLFYVYNFYNTTCTVKR